ncbi:MAG: 5-oxoprolinase subunit PxpB [Flavisolibacter sp.]
MTSYHPYSIFPLGDSALVIDFGNIIDEDLNKKVYSLYNLIKNSSISHIVDLIPAYSSLAVYYELHAFYQKNGHEKTAFEAIAEKVEELTNNDHQTIDKSGRTFRIPVCYSEQYGLDLQELAQKKNLAIEEVIELHTAKSYRVFMIGFLPGFTYMGKVDDRIVLPRRDKPKKVLPGAVGIAGNQTGVYPLSSPGGWNIIGRTPVSLFDKEKTDPVLFQAGDEVTFYSITEDEFEHYQIGNS